MAQQLEAYIEADLIEDEYFNVSVRVYTCKHDGQSLLKMAFSFVAGLYFQFKVRAVSEWNAEGEWAVESVIVELTQPPPMDGESSVVNLVQYFKKSLLSRGAHSLSLCLAKHCSTCKSTSHPSVLLQPAPLKCVLA